MSIHFATMNNGGMLDIKTIVFMYMIAMKFLKIYFYYISI